MKGNVVVVPFPFSDLTQVRRRPAFVIASLEGDDVILCQITSQSVRDHYAIPIDDSDFETGSLKQSSNMRPNRLFTADSHIILYQIGSLRENKVKEIISKVIEIVRK
jgi:mRNA interferase MazF